MYQRYRFCHLAKVVAKIFFFLVCFPSAYFWLRKNLTTDARETTPPGPYLYLRHQHMSRDQRLYFPSEGRRDQGFFASENPRGRLGLNPDPLGCRATTLTTTPPAPP